MASRRLYFASRSDCVIAPTLMWWPDQPTARSASQLSSVSPLRALITTRQPASTARRQASAASLSVPIWLTLSSSAFAAPCSTARRIRAGWVHSRSSPITMAREPTRARNCRQ